MAACFARCGSSTPFLPAAPPRKAPALPAPRRALFSASPVFLHGTATGAAKPSNQAVYTLRYALFPLNGDHQGVAPQRDFLLLSPAAADTDPSAKPDYETLMTMSRKASGTPHPLVFSFWKDDSGAAQGVEAVGDSDRVLHVKIGGVPAAMIIIGKHEG